MAPCNTIPKILSMIVICMMLDANKSMNKKYPQFLVLEKYTVLLWMLRSMSRNCRNLDLDN